MSVTDRRTDRQRDRGTGIPLVNADLLYVARPKEKFYVIFYIYISITN